MWVETLTVLNVTMDIDLANRSHGEITDIVLDPQEPHFDPMLVMKLAYPPSMVAFCPFNGCQYTFSGLPSGHLPIFPSERSFTINETDNHQLTVT